MADFKLVSNFQPSGDQPEAINELVDGIKNKLNHQTLLGVTGSGKTYTVGKVIEEIQKPTLIISHNKTLAAQLYGEFKSLFPNNAVEYFISYYDYYQPESYMPITDTFIEKDFSMNDEIDRLRLKATSSLLQRKDVIVVSSVSCIYGLGSPKEWKNQVVHLKKNDSVSRRSLTEALIDIYYKRNDQVLERCNFRIMGDIFEIFPAYEETAIRVDIFSDTIQSIVTFDPLTGEEIAEVEESHLFPARHFVSDKSKNKSVIKEIKKDLKDRIKFFNKNEKFLEEQRITQRTNFDIEMIDEIGYCSGIENYSRYFDGRKEGERPSTLIDFFPKDFLTVIDESHVTLPQIKGMYNGDRKRKENLIEHGFRLPAAFDNRPLRSEEFESIQNQIIYASATPADKELELSSGAITELINRPTGLVDPEIIVKPSAGQIDDLISEIKTRVVKKERCLVTTLTKKMSEDLSEYLSTVGIKVRYLHSEVKTIERVKILRDLRLGDFDVLVGINLLREGLDLPEVSLVAILDADKEGFLRSKSSLVQTSGRAARHIDGKVILYGDRVTDSMQYLLDETERRRDIQLAFNKKNNIVPKSIKKSVDEIMDSTSVAESFRDNEIEVKRDIKTDRFLNEDKKIVLEMIRQEMLEAADNLEFEKAASLRDEIKKLDKEIRISS
ncbi:MAG: excinuclease ABC subunit UvrB [Candidatus Marinimicrobia bacterium]|jgi:excinuclease ABC subunit B|nr:excinuclease ABC subunit UvrB [Candidatus Neomarinimicrobiota bacterium]MDG1268646.1 excinuclease ABC subunit UvrB [Candidatus Neomarinimicrobiota bacterium]MDG1900556.1 excinuclease ABC subunit UvrB [Candidatus Neomarinimicrobiota bacterium]MDG2188732.1 excinuclease ABC subunit UvrB [Candidatus Neomarinimicrobiota bacterium]|tara:strand:+ start:2039 stop:4039 length:2001 start_codon:yes stop_codon:yes gene_type:complete